MKNNLSLMSIIMILSVITSCKKEPQKESEISVYHFLECYNSQHLDSTSVTNKLIGTWDLKEQGCMDSYQSSATKVVKATFDSAGIFVVTENSNVITLGHWKVKIIDNYYIGIDSTTFELDIDKQSNYLNGLILFCGNQVLFSASYHDGCNTLFGKE